MPRAEKPFFRGVRTVSTAFYHAEHVERRVLRVCVECAMEDRQFDDLTRELGSGMGRRQVLRSAAMLGIAIVAGRGMTGDAEAARRGYGGPALPSSNEPDHFCYDGCCMECGGDDYRRNRLHGRFVTCYTNREFCESHDQGCCRFCIYWAGDSYATCRAVP